MCGWNIRLADMYMSSFDMIYSLDHSGFFFSANAVIPE